MEPARTPDGWAANTTRPLGSLPFVFAGIAALVVAIVLPNVPLVASVGWISVGACAAVLVVRLVRWTSRQLDTVQIERQTDELLEREPRLVPLFRPAAHEHGEYHKAS